MLYNNKFSSTSWNNFTLEFDFCENKTIMVVKFVMHQNESKQN